MSFLINKVSVRIPRPQVEILPITGTRAAAGSSRLIICFPEFCWTNLPVINVSVLSQHHVTAINYFPINYRLSAVRAKCAWEVS